MGPPEKDVTVGNPRRRSMSDNRMWPAQRAPDHDARTGSGIHHGLRSGSMRTTSKPADH
jgi:hypothetical protein